MSDTDCSDTQAAPGYNPLQRYRKWEISSMDSYIARIIRPAFVRCPPVLWNPDAGLMLMPYKSADPDLLPQVKVELSITPAVVKARYLASYEQTPDEVAKMLLNSSSLGEVHLHGFGEYLLRGEGSEAKLAEQVRYVLLAGARVGQWYEFCSEEG